MQDDILGQLEQDPTILSAPIDEIGRFRGQRGFRRARRGFGRGRGFRGGWYNRIPYSYGTPALNPYLYLAALQMSAMQNPYLGNPYLMNPYMVNPFQAPAPPVVLKAPNYWGK